VDILQIKQNTSDRMVIHSRDDTVVWFEGNAPDLAAQLEAKTYFVDGMGHFDQPAAKGITDRYSTRIALS
jgi:predicted alpha/beta hydrolase family esterase